MSGSQLMETPELVQYVEEVSLRVEQLAQLPSEQLQALQLELEWRRARWKRWSSILSGPRAQWGLVAWLSFIVGSLYAGSQGFLGERALWWVLAGVFALQLCFAFYAIHVRDALQLELQLVEFARRQQAGDRSQGRAPR